MTSSPAGTEDGRPALELLGNRSGSGRGAAHACVVLATAVFAVPVGGAAATPTDVAGERADAVTSADAHHGVGFTNAGTTATAPLTQLATTNEAPSAGVPLNGDAPAETDATASPAAPAPFDPIASIAAAFSDPNRLGANTLGYDDVTHDPDTGETLIRNVRASWTLNFSADGEEVANIEIDATAPGLSLYGYDKSGDLYTAERIIVPAFSFDVRAILDDEVVRVGFASAGYEVLDATWPAIPEITVDPERPFMSYAPLITASWQNQSYASSRIDASVTYLESATEKQVTMTGASVATGYANGRLERLETEESRSVTTSLSPGGAEGPDDFTITTGAQVYEGLNIRPLAALLVGEPDDPVGAPSIIIERASTDPVEAEIDDITFSIGATELVGFGASKPEKPLFVLLDEIVSGTTDPTSPAFISEVVGIVAALSLESYSLGEVEFHVPDPEIRFSFGGIELADFDASGLGRLATGLFSVEAPDTTVAYSGFEIADVGFPTLEAILTLAASAAEADAREAAGEIDASPPVEDILAVIPQVGNLELTGLLVETPAIDGPVRLGAVRLSQDGHIGPIPTRNAFTLEDLSIPASVIEDDDEAPAILGALGLDAFNLSGRIDLAWDEASGDVAIGPIEVNLEDVGAVSISAALSGVPRFIFEEPERAQEVVATLAFEGLDARFTDEGVTDTLLSQIADDADASRETIAESLVLQLRELIGSATDEALAEEVTGAIRTFLSDPGTLNLTAAPSQPVPVAQLVALIAMSPAQLRDLLGVSIAANPPQ